jgi:hypothetical protein
LDRHSTANLRVKTFSAAFLIVAAGLWLGFSQKYPVHEDRDASTGVLAIVEQLRPAAEQRNPPAAPTAVHRAQSAPVVPSAPETAGSRTTAINLGCINTLDRDDHQPCNRFTVQAQREIAIPPVRSILTGAQQRNRQILGAITAGAATYARGEAQKYADPRDDPLYDPGSDPSTAAMRPCAGQSTTRGTGAHLTGRSCQMYH